MMNNNNIIKSYSELSKIKTYKDRFNYLKIGGDLGTATFGFDRYLNQSFYNLREWKKVRAEIIVRDNGCDMGIEGYEIVGKILVHHINVVTLDDLKNKREKLLDPEYLITTSMNTHNAIHYGDEGLLILTPIERSPNDTKLW